MILRVFGNELYCTSTGSPPTIMKYTANPVELLASLDDAARLPRVWVPTAESLESGGGWVIVDRPRGMDVEGIKTETR